MTSDHQFKMRLPGGLRTRLSAAAKQNRRSLTAEIAYRLEVSFPSTVPQVPGADEPFDDLSTRSRNALRRAGLHTLDEVHHRALQTGLRGIDNFGDTCRREVFRRLAKNGFDVSPYAEWVYG